MADVTGQVNTSQLTAVPRGNNDDGSITTLLQPVNQQPRVVNVAVGASALSTYGFSQAQADSIPLAINTIIADLIAAGIMKPV